MRKGSQVHDNSQDTRVQNPQKMRTKSQVHDNSQDTRGQNPRKLVSVD